MSPQLTASAIVLLSPGLKWTSTVCGKRPLACAIAGTSNNASRTARRIDQLYAGPQLREPDLLQPLLQVRARGDRGVARRTAARQRCEIHLFPRMDEARHRVTIARRVGRVDDAMRGRLVAAVGQVLQHVAGVDDDRVE